MSLSSALAPSANAELAPHWRVNGTDLPNGATLNYTATLTGTATLSVPGLLTLVSENCSGHGKIVGSAAKVSGKGKESVLECEEIEVEDAPRPSSQLVSGTSTSRDRKPKRRLIDLSEVL